MIQIKVIKTNRAVKRAKYVTLTGELLTQFENYHNRNKTTDYCCLQMKEKNQFQSPRVI